MHLKHQSGGTGLPLIALAIAGRPEAGMSSLEDTRLIFVSHSGEDTWVARQIAKEMKKRDIIRLNDIDQYFEQLGARVASGRKDD